jgi:hypothetical protein
LHQNLQSHGRRLATPDERSFAPLHGKALEGNRDSLAPARVRLALGKGHDRRSSEPADPLLRGICCR